MKTITLARLAPCIPPLLWGLMSTCIIGSASAQLASGQREHKAAEFKAGIKAALEKNAGAKFIDASLPLEERVNDLMNTLTLEEKVGLIHGVSSLDYGSVERLAIPSLGMNDGPQGVRGPIATKFPAGINMAATWDVDLIREVGKALARETLAVGNRVMLAPSADIVRTPLGGRTFESFGEDPWLIGAIAVPYIQGIQAEGVAACVKPIVANNQEKWRRTIDVKVSERALREIYLPGFEGAVRVGGAWAVMGAYNKINGTWACHHDLILNRILKKEWAFDGVVISDWGAWHDTVGAINGGSTLEMPAPTPAKGAAKTLEMLQKGEIDPARFEDAVRRNVRFMIRSGAFDPDREKGAINTLEHQALARRVAEESLVLLKNQGDILPLDPGTLKSMAIIGPNADWKLTRATYRDSGGSGAVFPPHEITPLEGLRRKVGDRVAIKFVEGISYAEENKTDFEAGKAVAVEAAKASEVAIVFAGTNHTYDREATSNIKPENADKPDLGLIGPQAELIRAVAEANPRTIVVLINGAPVVTGDWIDQVPALVEAWFPGMEGGNAIANVLFGDVNPSGKLPLTFGKKLEDWRVHQLGTEAYPGTGRNGFVKYDDGIWVGYRWFDKAKIEPEFPFGFGLSYTTFGFANGTATRTESGWDVSFEISNTGKLPGAEVAQLYVQPVSPKVDRPVRELKRFRKLSLRPGEKQTVSFKLGDEDLRYWDEAKNGWVVDPGRYVLAVGNSSRHLPLQIEVEKP